MVGHVPWCNRALLFAVTSTSAYQLPTSEHGDTSIIYVKHGGDKLDIFNVASYDTGALFRGMTGIGVDVGRRYNFVGLVAGIRAHLQDDLGSSTPAAIS